MAVLCYTFGDNRRAGRVQCGTHGTMVFNSQTYRDWMASPPRTCALGVAPLFYITLGLIGHMGVALLARCPLAGSNHRFEAGVVIDAIREHQPTFTVGSITVFINLSGLDEVTREDWSSFRMIYSGGAPIAPPITDQFIAKTGLSLKPGAAVTEEELIKFCKQQMAAYKYPRSIEFVDELPKTTTGKILRRELRGSNS